MPRYLIVADQTATSPELVAQAKELADEHSGSTFALLLPALLPSHVRGGPFDAVTRGRAEPARTMLERAGLTVERTTIATPPRCSRSRTSSTSTRAPTTSCCSARCPPASPAGCGSRSSSRPVSASRLPVRHIEAQLPSRLEFRRATLRDHERIQALWTSRASKPSTRTSGHADHQPGRDRARGGGRGRARRRNRRHGRRLAGLRLPRRRRPGRAGAAASRRRSSPRRTRTWRARATGSST